MNTLFIINESPAQVEKAWHGLRLAVALAKRQVSLRVFLFADGVDLARPQSGAFDIAELSATLARLQVPVSACASCLDKRGIGREQLTGNVARASLDDAAEWTAWAGKILVY